MFVFLFFFSSRRRHTRCSRDWSSDVCSSDLVEDIRIQEVEDDDSHLFIASAAESSHQVEPVFTLQFFFGDSLDHVQKLLGDEAFKFAEGLLLKNRPYLFFFVACALAENQLSNFFKQGRGWVLQISLQFFLALDVSQLRKLTAREL